MRVLPTVITNETTSAAERRLHGLLAKVDLPEWTAVHSLNLAKVDRQRWGELDFVLVGPAGVIAIEVKGGGVGRTSDGWETVDRYGDRYAIKDPFKQAERGLVALRDWLEERLPVGEYIAVSCGYAVAFPDVEFHETSPEWAPEMIGDASRLADGASIARWLRKLGRYWQGRTSIDRQLEPAQVKSLVRLIRPEFELVPSLSVRGRQAVAVSNRLTDEQLALLDAIEANDRLLVEGGAGTGKTFMAAELARRRVALEGDPSQVKLLVPRPNAALPFTDLLPRELSVDSRGVETDGPPVRYLIVDEGQDLLYDKGLDAIDRSVIGGLSHGRWALFFDPNQQARLRGAFDATALAIAREAAPTLVRLPRNIRNTHEIVETVQQATEADIGVPGGGHGPEVSVDIVKDDLDYIDRCKARLQTLSREQVPPAEIAVITWLDPTVVQQALDRQPYATATFEEGSRALPDAAAVPVASPLAFQGLEAVYALIGPLPSPATEIGVAESYVTMTRARAAMWIYASSDVVQMVAERMSTGARAMTRGPET